MNLKSIKTESDYSSALERLEKIFDAKKELKRAMNWKY